MPPDQIAAAAPAVAAAPAAAAAPLPAVAAIVGAAPAPAAAAPAAAPAASAPAAAPAAAAAPAEAAPAEAAPISVAIPGKDATPEDWAAFYKSIGAPESADGYELPVPDGDSGEFAKTAAGWMAEAGLLPQQARALAEKWNAHVAQLTQANAEAAAAAETAALANAEAENNRQAQALQNEWGMKHDENMGLTKRAFQQFIAPFAPGEKGADVIASIEKAVGYAATIKIMHAIGKGLGTGQAHGLGGEGLGEGKPKSLEERLYPNG